MTAKHRRERAEARAHLDLWTHVMFDQSKQEGVAWKNRAGELLQTADIPVEHVGLFLAAFDIAEELDMRLDPANLEGNVPTQMARLVWIEETLITPQLDDDPTVRTAARERTDTFIRESRAAARPYPRAR